MKTDLSSISKIFTERLFRIPDYQRGYAWSERQLKDYWSDLINLEKGKNHYTGVLTLEDVPSDTVKQWEDDHWIIHAKSYTPFYVVDGQQRLTTTIILIQSIIEVFPPEKKINYTSINDIKRKFLFDSKDEGVSRSYIFGYEKDNPSYEFLKAKIYQESSDNSFPIQETIYTHNLEFAKNFFLQKLKELTDEEIEQIYKSLTQNFLFNIYAISDDVDVYVAFETMNNRGKALSHLELLKNRLIYLSTKFDAEPYERSHLRKIINESWKSVYHYLGKNKLNPLDDDFFLENHFILYFGNLLEDSDDSSFKFRRYRRGFRLYHKDYLLEEIFTAKNIGTNVIKDKSLTMADIKTYSKSLKDSVENWYHILNPDEANMNKDEIEWLKKLNRIGIHHALPLIMVFLQKENNTKKRISLFEKIESILFLLCLVRYRYYIEYDDTKFLDFACKLSRKELTTNEVIEELREYIDSIKKDKRINETIIEEFRKRGFYSWMGIKYFLFEYDLFLKSKSKTHREKINWDNFIEDDNDYHTIEHVYPQNPRKKCWTDKFKQFSSTEKKKLRNSLGNLVPLSQRKNSSFQNKCFKEKLGNKSTTIGFKYGSYSENEISCYEDWTSKEILERGIKLLDFMEERWGIDIGDNTQKTKFLGLDFLLKKTRSTVK